jgi:hypothetical protein
MNVRRYVLLVVAAYSLLSAHAAVAAPASGGLPDQAKAKVVAHWNAARRSAAQPRDLYLDQRGLAYTKTSKGALQAYGHSAGSVHALKQQPPRPMGKPSGTNDSEPPHIDSMNPAADAIIGESHTFSALITDDSGLKSVSFVIQYPNGTTQSFTPSASGDTWGITLSGFSDGSWQWWVTAKDRAGKGGNSATSAQLGFTVDTGGTTPPPPPPPGVGYTIRSAPWTGGGLVQIAAGRIYFEMPANNRRRNRKWNGYVCSGTVVTDGVAGQSLILTAAHCVYDDQHNAFARNVMFIPNQSGTLGAGTDQDCSNDPLGCWVPSYGVVDRNWTNYVFPDNIPWDYAFYVVNDSGAHAGPAAGSEALDQAAGSMQLSFTPQPYIDDGDPGAHSIDFTHALGYSYSEDPKFMYCAEDMTAEGDYNWWLASCDLSGGSSGGPWVQKMDSGTGNGPVISVNSWGYTTSSGMAGPKLSGTSAECVFGQARSQQEPGSLADGEAGIATDCP